MNYSEARQAALAGSPQPNPPANPNDPPSPKVSPITLITRSIWGDSNWLVAIATTLFSVSSPPRMFTPSVEDQAATDWISKEVVN